jgi:hypothetical protein
MTQEQTPASQTESAPDELGSLDAAALAFEKREQALEEPEAETDTAEADPDAEAESEPEEDTEPELEEVTVEGVTLNLPKDQAEALRKSTLRQADYSRKMNEVSAKEKQAAAVLETAEKMRQGAEKFADVLASVRMLDQQIKQYEGLDWQKLRTEDPGNYAAHAADLQTLKLNKQQTELQARAVAQQVEESTTQTLQTKRGEMFEALQKKIPDWSNQKGQEITEYALAQGMAFETLAKATDPALVIALEKARKFDALQKSKTELKAKAKEAPPVLKPGVRQAVKSPQEDAMVALRKFKTRDAAEVAFLARMK